MSDSQPDPEHVTATGFVGRAIEQPVKRAVREALAEHEAERAVVGPDETTGDDGGAEGEVDADGTDDTADASRVSPLRLLLLAGTLAGVSYAVMRRRQGGDGDPHTAADEDAVAEIRDTEEAADDSDAHDATPEGERSTAPAEDATTN